MTTASNAAANDRLVGCDPEVFIRDKLSKLTTPCIEILNGNKAVPYPVTHGAVQEDNVMAEFNIDPAATREEFLFNIRSVMDDMGDLLDEQGFEILIEASQQFQPVQMRHPQALIVGCMPDFNAYTLKKNKPMTLPEYERYSGGHVHISFPHMSDMDLINCIRALDVVLGVPSLVLDKDDNRRKKYGKAGAYRLTDYGGVEYRTLSNFWLATDEYVNWVYDAVQDAIDNRDTLSHYAIAYGAQEIIDTNNPMRALMLIEDLNIPMPT